MRHMTIAIDKAVFIATDLEKHASYEDEISFLELKNALTSMQISNQTEILLLSYKYQKRSKVTTSGLFHSFCFSYKLQNYSKSGQILRYSIAFYHRFVAVLQLEI